MAESILIVGGSGSIGKRLRAQLPDSINLDVQATSGNFYSCDVTKVEDIERCAEHFGPPLKVIYLSSIVRDSLKPVEFAQIMSVNVTGLANFLTVFHNRISHFILTSSISVYGWPEQHLAAETDPRRPVSGYGISKLAAEEIAVALCSKMQIPLSILRVAQLFGLESAENSLPHLLVKKLKQKEPLELRASPETERDYLHVDDFIDLLQDVLRAPQEGVFNVGIGQGVRLGAIFEAASQAFGSTYTVSESAAFQPSQVMDTRRIQAAYGFEPKRDLLTWFKEQKAIDDQKKIREP